MIEYTDKWYIDGGTYILFEGRWTDEVADKMFKVTASQRFPVIYPLIIQGGKYYDFSLDDNGLFPDKPNTLYEVGFGVKGNCVLHIRLPSDRYFNVLEKSGFIPREDLSANQYIGGFTKYELTIEEPRRLRVFTLKNAVNIVFRILADSYEDEKIVLYATVNRLKIEKLSEDERKSVEESWDKLVAEDRIRVLKSYELLRW